MWACTSVGDRRCARLRGNPYDAIIVELFSKSAGRPDWRSPPVLCLTGPDFVDVDLWLASSITGISSVFTARLIFPIRVQPVLAAIKQPLQRLSGLFLMNHPFMIGVARSMLTQGGARDGGRDLWCGAIRLFLSGMGRSSEQGRADDYPSDLDDISTDLSRWQSLVQAMLISE